MFRVPLPNLVGEEKQARGKAQTPLPSQAKVELIHDSSKGQLVFELEYGGVR